MTRKKDFMESVVDEHGDDFVIRLFAANKSLAQVDRELRKAGYHMDYPGSSYRRINRLVKEVGVSDLFKISNAT
jgi:hypothetical protein